jgi:thiamine-phosphate pyrophosphorylase
MNRRLPSRLYAIADTEAGGGDVVERVRGMLAGGARVVQLRWKGSAAGPLFAAATACFRLCRESHALFLVNDRVDVALACGADGVHLGQSDLPLDSARRLLGPGRWIGISTHDAAQARRAAEGGADYVGFGPMFPTATKQTGYSSRGIEALRAVRRAVRLPIVAIGGLTPQNALPVLDAGADAVAMIGALTAPDVADRVRGALLVLEAGGS